MHLPSFYISKPARIYPNESLFVGRFVARNIAVNDIKKLVTSIHIWAASVITAVELDRKPPIYRQKWIEFFSFLIFNERTYPQFQ